MALEKEEGKGRRVEEEEEEEEGCEKLKQEPYDGQTGSMEPKGHAEICETRGNKHTCKRWHYVLSLSLLGKKKS